MDNRPGPRRRGNAFYAESARAALGIGGEVHSLADVPLPLVHTALGMAVCAVVAALRPQVLGLRTSVIVCGALALATAFTLVLYDRLVYGRDLRHAVAATALPMAAIGAFVAVLAGTGDLVLRLPAGLVAALVVGRHPAPRRPARRRPRGHGHAAAPGRRPAWWCSLPLLLAAYDSDLARGPSAAVAGGAVLLVTVDALLTEELHGRVAVAGAVLIAAIMAGLVFVLPVSGRDTVRAALLLVIWYGLRGLVGGAADAPVATRRLVVEYGLFVAVAAGVVAARALRG